MSGTSLWSPGAFASLSPLGSAAAIAVFILIELLVLSLPFAAYVLWKERRKDALRILLVSALLFAAAFALRWLLPVHSLIHENRHGFELSSDPPLNDGITPHGIASAHVVLAKLFALVWPGTEPMFAMGVFWSSAAVVGMYWLSRQLFRSEHAALACALMLLLQPIAILMAPTEEFMVTAQGAGLVGIALLWFGMRHERLWPAAAGVLFICVAASAREITLLLAPLVPVAIVFASPRERRFPWRSLLSWTAVVGLLLGPRALQILDAARNLESTPGFMGFPRFPFDMNGLDAQWVGWWSPFAASWSSWLSVLAALALFADVVRPRAQMRRTALACLALLLVVHLQGGLVATGWFPSSLRHQLFSQAMWLLPIGYWVARLDASFVARGRWVPAAVVAALSLGAVVYMVVRPESFRLEVPMTQEYRFFASAIESLPKEGRALALRAPDDNHQLHLPARWFRTLRPQWQIVELHEDARSRVSPGKRDLYFFVDRACFLNRGCFGDNADSRGPRAKEGVRRMRDTRYGLMLAHCAELLDGSPWEEVARAELMASPKLPAPGDLPVAGARSAIVVLRLAAAKPSQK